ncbi:MAG: acyltransferase [Chthonomonas sp.]|nr:acyltransferase [Chthonomonas sp.]
MDDRANARSSERLGFIEGLRGLAALYVVAQHICTMVDPRFLLMRKGAEPAWLASVMAPFWYGHFAVSAFIVLSGFCLQMSLYTSGTGQLRDLRRFLKRRCWRILPPYYACLALSLITVHFVTSKHSGPPWNQYIPVTGENLAAHILMIHNFSREWMYKINGVLWSISIEFQLYFLFPALCLALWRFGSRSVVPLTALTVASALSVYDSADKLYVWYFGLFVLGMAGARWAFDRRLPKVPTGPMTALAVFALAAAIMSIGWTKQLAVRDSLMGIAIVSVLVAGSTKPDMAWVRFLGARPLVWLGTFSYSLYLVHHPVLQWLTHLKPESIATTTRLFAYLVACLPIVLACCYLFYRVFEKPFIAWGKSTKSGFSKIPDQVS